MPRQSTPRSRTWGLAASCACRRPDCGTPVGEARSQHHGGEGCETAFRGCVRDAVRFPFRAHTCGLVPASDVNWLIHRSGELDDACYPEGPLTGRWSAPEDRNGVAASPSRRGAPRGGWSEGFTLSVSLPVGQEGWLPCGAGRCRSPAQGRPDPERLRAVQRLLLPIPRHPSGHRRVPGRPAAAGQRGHGGGGGAARRLGARLGRFAPDRQDQCSWAGRL